MTVQLYYKIQSPTDDLTSAAEWTKKKPDTQSAAPLKPKKGPTSGALSSDNLKIYILGFFFQPESSAGAKSLQLQVNLFLDSPSSTRRAFFPGMIWVCHKNPVPLSAVNILTLHLSSAGDLSCGLLSAPQPHGYGESLDKQQNSGLSLHWSVC